MSPNFSDYILEKLKSRCIIADSFGFMFQLKAKLLRSWVHVMLDRIVQLYVNFAKINSIYLQEAIPRRLYIFFTSEMLSRLIA